MKTPQGGLEVIANLPPGGPIPPDMLPAKNIKLISKTDTTAIYTYTSGTSGVEIKTVMKKIVAGTDTLWDVLTVEQMQK